MTIFSATRRNGRTSHRPPRHTSTQSLIDPSPNPTLPDFDADNFKPNQRIDNPYSPMIRGTVYTYAKLPEEAGDDTEWNDVFATFESKMVNGVKTHVVRDTRLCERRARRGYAGLLRAGSRRQRLVFRRGSPTPFRYDDDGNFLGTSTAGSWLANGVDAFPGYIMPTREVLEALGNGYFEEFAPGAHRPGRSHYFQRDRRHRHRLLQGRAGNAEYHAARTGRPRSTRNTNPASVWSRPRS